MISVTDLWSFQSSQNAEKGENGESDADSPSTPRSVEVSMKFLEDEIIFGYRNPYIYCLSWIEKLLWMFPNMKPLDASKADKVWKYTNLFRWKTYFWCCFSFYPKHIFQSTESSLVTCLFLTEQLTGAQAYLAHVTYYPRVFVRLRQPGKTTLSKWPTFLYFLPRKIQPVIERIGPFPGAERTVRKTPQWFLLLL